MVGRGSLVILQFKGDEAVVGFRCFGREEGGAAADEEAGEGGADMKHGEEEVVKARFCIRRGGRAVALFEIAEDRLQGFERGAAQMAVVLIHNGLGPHSIPLFHREAGGDICPRFHQMLGNEEAPLRHRKAERGMPAGVCCIGLGARCQQQLDHLRIVPAHSEMEGCFFLLIAGVRVGPRCQEQTRGFDSPITGSQQ